MTAGDVLQGTGLLAYASASMYWLRLLTRAYLAQAKDVAIINHKLGIGQHDRAKTENPI